MYKHACVSDWRLSAQETLIYGATEVDLSFRSITPGGKEVFAAIYAVTEPVPAHRHDYYEISFTMRGGDSMKMRLGVSRSSPVTCGSCHRAGGMPILG